MLNTYLNLTTISEWITFLAALFLLKSRTGLWRLLIPVLALTVIAEFVGWYLTFIARLPNNAAPYNFLLLVNGIGMLYLLGSAPPLGTIHQPPSHMVKLVLAGFLAFGLINLCWLQGLNRYNYYTEVVADLLTAVLSCYVLFRMLWGETYVELFRNEYFWLANGLLFSSLGSILLYIFINALREYWRQRGVNVYGYINYTVNLLLYGSLIIAMLCRNRTTR